MFGSQCARVCVGDLHGSRAGAASLQGRRSQPRRAKSQLCGLPGHVPLGMGWTLSSGEKCLWVSVLNCFLWTQPHLGSGERSPHMAWTKREEDVAFCGQQVMLLTQRCQLRVPRWCLLLPLNPKLRISQLCPLCAPYREEVALFLDCRQRPGERSHLATSQRGGPFLHSAQCFWDALRGGEKWGCAWTKEGESL